MRRNCILTLLVTLLIMINTYEITRESLEELKAKASFEVFNYEEHPFKDYAHAQLMNMIGVNLKVSEEFAEPLPEFSIGGEYGPVAYPLEFDGRVKWSGCLRAIRNQNQCGGCWAFASTSVLGDRLCIQSNGLVNVNLSQQLPISCDTAELGCSGGYISKSWAFLTNSGTVTEECYPYTSSAGTAASCLDTPGTCVNKAIPYKKYYAKNFVGYYASVSDIKNEIFNNGPVETGMLVYQDFYSYKSGIYQKSAGTTLLGGHAVKIVGWGTTGSVNYWLVANSWSALWGENGYFRIEINNCCSFEQNVVSAQGDLSKLHIDNSDMMGLFKYETN
jgi:cathepsin B